jgi:hypothetical protein
MTGIKLMMLGGGAVEPEDPGDITYAAGYAGSIYEPIGWDTVDLELKGSCGRSYNSSGWSLSGKGSLVTKDGVVPGDVTLGVANMISGGTGVGYGGTGGSTLYGGGNGGASTMANIDGTKTFAGGGGGDGGPVPGGGDRPGNIEGEIAGTPGYTSSNLNGGDGYCSPTGPAPCNCYYGGGGGGGGGTQGGYGGAPRNGGSGAGQGSTGGSINYTTVTVGNNGGNGSAKVSWG